MQAAQGDTQQQGRWSVLQQAATMCCGCDLAGIDASHVTQQHLCVMRLQAGSAKKVQTLWSYTSKPELSALHVGAFS
jgi:hypothetical protein